MPQNESNLVGTAVQGVEALLVAILLAMLRQSIRKPFLDYWVMAWRFLTMALLALLTSHWSPVVAKPLWAIFCAAEYGFGFYLWIGCRNYGDGRRIVAGDAWWCAPALMAAILLVAFCPTFDHLFAIQSVFLSVLFTISYLALRQEWRRRRKGDVGYQITACALLLLAGIFAHYFAVVGFRAWGGDRDAFAHLRYAPLYDALLQLLLAMGIIVLATESARQDLENANQKLSDAGERLAIMARTDPLTGALNRHAFAVLERRADLLGCVVAIDLDGLKPINDTLGHAVGDEALKTVARTLADNFRARDFVFRWGGDEFLVVLPNGAATEADKRLDAINRQLATTLLPSVKDTRPLKLSWGAVNFSGPDDLDAAVSRADAIMYERKQRHKHGRDSSFTPSAPAAAFMRPDAD